MNTPRTDTQTHDWNHAVEGMCPHPKGDWVDADFARELERELVNAADVIATCKKALQYVLDNHHEGSGEFENTVISALQQ